MTYPNLGKTGSHLLSTPLGHSSLHVSVLVVVSVTVIGPLLIVRTDGHCVPTLVSQPVNVASSPSPTVTVTTISTVCDALTTTTGDVVGSQFPVVQVAEDEVPSSCDFDSVGTTVGDAALLACSSEPAADGGGGEGGGSLGNPVNPGLIVPFSPVVNGSPSATSGIVPIVTSGGIARICAVTSFKKRVQQPQE